MSFGNLLPISGAALAIVLAAACATSTSPSHDDDSGTHTSAGVGGSGGAGASAQGGNGQGGNTGPCAVDCGSIQTPQCQRATCNPQTAQCEVGPADEGMACDDGSFCTVGETCQTGTCSGGGPNDCGMNAAPCQAITCDETAQSCAQQAVTDGTACQPADLCITGATCLSGTCSGGSPQDCFFFPLPNECHVASCNSMTGMCEAMPGNEGLPCTDQMDLCTDGKTCASGVCQGGAPKDCSALTQDCVLGVCDTSTGQCVTQNLMNGDPCDDLNACTSGETCQSGMCANGAPVTACVAGDSCCPTGCSVANDADCAIQALDIGPYGSTFSSTLTRGYWFTAPVNFTIVELRVPTDVGTGPQNIQVVKFTGGPPPLYTASTTAYTTLFYANQVPGTSFVSVNVAVQAGDVIGILGARGTGTMANSYSANTTYNTTIFGSPMTLTRLIYQGTIDTAPAGALSQSTGVYSRIEMNYGP